MDDADHKTLRLAVPELTDALLRKYLVYLRVLSKAGGPSAAPTAHQRALEAAELSQQQVSSLTPMIRDFTGKRWTLSHLKSRQQQLTRELSSEGLPGLDRAKVEKKLVTLNTELRSLEDLEPLRSRYGTRNVELLLAQENDLLGLHPTG
jgi:hypothetical protein